MRCYDTLIRPFFIGFFRIMNSTLIQPKQKLLAIAKPDPDEGLVSQYKYAEMIGRSRVYIGRLVEKGVITLVRGKIDPVIADRQILENTSPRKNSSESGKGKNDGTNGDTLNAVKIEKERFARDLLELDLKRKSGEYIDKKKADTAYSNKISAVIRRLHKTPKRISPAIAKEGDRIRCEDMIFNEIKEAVEEFGQHG